MEVSGIGVQTITPTTGTAQQNPNPDRADDRAAPPANSARVNPPSSSSTGNIVDKLA